MSCRIGFVIHFAPSSFISQLGLMGRRPVLSLFPNWVDCVGPATRLSGPKQANVKTLNWKESCSPAVSLKNTVYDKHSWSLDCSQYCPISIGFSKSLLLCDRLLRLPVAKNVIWSYFLLDMNGYVAVVLRSGR